jgi:glycosyltransferase involved in cell wall biosynthesis
MNQKTLHQLRRLGVSRLPMPAAVRGLLRSVFTETARIDVADRSSLVPGLALIGYPLAEFGLGQALRQLAAAAERAALPFTAVDIDHGISARQNDRRIARHMSQLLDRQVNLLVHSLQSATHAARLLGRRAFAGRHNILYPFWELPEVPDDWVGDLAAFDEIWAPSRFVAKALEAKLSRPVFHLPPPIELPEIRLRQRSDFGLPADPFLFYFVFDFSSHSDRKNPEAVIAAFRHCAATQPPGRVGLVLKTLGADIHQAAWRRLTRLIDGMHEIFVIDRVLDRAEVLALHAACDCFVSLHRSEGFGLGIAEAMAVGKPVIATDFGGATDLLAPDRACPVGYRLIPVMAGQYPGGEGQCWAEPNILQAANWMRRVVENPEWAKQLAAAGRAFVAKELSPERIGATMRRRLATVAGI